MMCLKMMMGLSSIAGVFKPSNIGITGVSSNANQSFWGWCGV